MCGEDDDDDDFIDIWSNKIFENLRTRIRDFEKQASEMNWVVLLPKDDTTNTENSLEQQQEIQMDLSFLKKHVVYPSPYLKDEYVNFNGNRMVIENGFVTVVDTGVKILILQVETCFCSFGSYKVVCIEKPIISSATTNSIANLKRTGSMKEIDSIEEWTFLLNRNAKNSSALRSIENHAEKLTKTYVLVANKIGINDFLKRINSAVENGMQILQRDNPNEFEYGKHSIIKRVLEAYAFLGVHDMVFDSLIGMYSAKEAQLRMMVLEKNKNKTSNKILEKNSFNFFKDMNKCKCPLAKLEYLRDYLTASFGGNTEKLTSDEILDILVERISHAYNEQKQVLSPPHIIANLQYMKRFTLGQTPNELNYLMCQFHAAVTFVYGMDVDSNHQNVVDAKGYNNNNNKILSHPSPMMDSFQMKRKTSTSTSSMEKQEQIQSKNTQYGNTVGEKDDENFDDFEFNDKNSPDSNLGGFLLALGKSNADVITSSSSSMNSM